MDFSSLWMNDFEIDWLKLGSSAQAMVYSDMKAAINRLREVRGSLPGSSQIRNCRGNLGLCPSPSSLASSKIADFIWHELCYCYCKSKILSNNYYNLTHLPNLNYQIRF